MRRPHCPGLLARATRADTVLELPVTTEAAFSILQIWLCMFTLVFVLLNFGQLNALTV